MADFRGFASEMARHYLNEALDFMKSNLAESYTRANQAHGFSYVQLGRMKRLLDLIKQPVSEKKLRMSRINFYKFFKEHDRRRSVNFFRGFFRS